MYLINRSFDHLLSIILYFINAFCRLCNKNPLNQFAFGALFGCRPWDQPMRQVYLIVILDSLITHALCHRYRQRGLLL